MQGKKSCKEEFFFNLYLKFTIPKISQFQIEKVKKPHLKIKKLVKIKIKFRSITLIICLLIINKSINFKKQYFKNYQRKHIATGETTNSLEADIQLLTNHFNLDFTLLLNKTNKFKSELKEHCDYKNASRKLMLKVQKVFPKKRKIKCGKRKFRCGFSADFSAK
ncbi:hypothetical protein BpHYR1_020454 [Brachionus plicatilis]|uniref:Uncharacterized protein n=1 Tax=Brachionus plicatilis TaxID=10195 RepID=A0A3M7PXS8_BRAPC|nr:hypothetical protein BpHYR1_020454 [Brachionus plicatilis]